MKLPDQLIIGHYLIYLSTKSHWFISFKKDENGILIHSLGRLKIVRYPYKDSIPGRKK